MEPTPKGNGDVVHTRELYDVERRITAHIDSAIAGLDDKFVLREADRVRHSALDERMSSACDDIGILEAKTDVSRRLLYIGVGILVTVEFAAKVFA